MVFIRVADTLDDGTGLLPYENSLLTTRALHRVSVCVQWHDLTLDVVLDKAKRLARGSVVAVNVWLFSVNGPQKRVVVRPYDVFSDVAQ